MAQQQPKEDLAAIEFNPMDLRTMEEIANQLSACRLASEQKGGPRQSTGAQVLSIFLKMVEEKLSTFVKDLKTRMVAAKTT